MALPSGLTSTITGIDTPDGPVDRDRARRPPPPCCSPTTSTSAAATCSAARTTSPTSTQEIDAKICWMDETGVLQAGKKYAIKHTTRWGRAMVATSATGST